MTRKYLHTFIFLTGLLLASNAFSSDAPPRLPKRIIAHEMIVLPPQNRMPDRPLPSQNVLEEAIACGLDELTFFVPNGTPSVIRNLIKLSEKAEKTKLRISLCICIPRTKLKEEWLKPIEEWCNAAKTHPGIATADGRAVIWTYHVGAKPLTEWKSFFEELRNRNIHPFIIGEMGAFAIVRKKNFLQEVDEWAELFDGLYFFGALRDECYPALLNAVEKARKKRDTPLVSVCSVLRGYWRWNNDKQNPRTQLFKGTERYQELWDSVLKERDRVDWVHVATMNDSQEHTFIYPSRNNAGVYAELTRWNAARLRGEKSNQNPIFFLTAPSELKNGPQGLNEYVYEFRLVAPDSGEYRAVMTFRRPSGEIIREKTFLLNAKQTRGVWNLRPVSGEFGNDRFIEVEGKIYSNGKVICSGTLPVPVWPENEAVTLYKAPRTIRLSAPEQQLEAPQIALNGSSLTVEPMPENDPERRVDILYNMHIKGSDGVSLGSAVDGKSQLPDVPITDPWYFRRGFRQAALITRDGRVAWSKPLWVEHDLPMPETNRPKFDREAVNELKTETIRINFAPPEFRQPKGYLFDNGKAFGTRGNGLYYGWSRDVSKFSRNRRLKSHPILDTLIPFGYHFTCWSWHIALPNGDWRVQIIQSDPAFKHTHRLAVNGKKIVSTKRNSTDPVEHDLTVTITDNLLTLSDGSLINSIQLTKIKE